MRVNEAARELGLSRRAIKYYEEKGLLHVKKDQNGYRNFTEEDIRTLKEISVYRKLGIGLEEIKSLLKNPDSGLLEQIYEEKKRQLSEGEEELEALKKLIEDGNVEEAFAAVDYKSLAQAMQDMFPGFYGYFFMNHFLPYLQINITTSEQKEAYEAIIRFWDETNIRLPLLLKLSNFLLYKCSPKPNLQNMADRMEEELQRLVNTTEDEYEKLKEQTRKNVKKRNRFFIKYHPMFISQRRFMRRLQDCGYNDVFLPNMIRLSPKYREYHEAMDKMNKRINQDLGLYYDSDFHLVMKKDA